MIDKLESREIEYRRIAGSLKGIASHYWSGKADGIKDSIQIIKESASISSPSIPASPCPCVPEKALG